MLATHARSRQLELPVQSIEDLSPGGVDVSPLDFDIEAGRGIPRACRRHERNSLKEMYLTACLWSLVRLTVRVNISHARTPISMKRMVDTQSKEPPAFGPRFRVTPPPFSRDGEDAAPVLMVTTFLMLREEPPWKRSDKIVRILMWAEMVQLQCTPAPPLIFTLPLNRPPPLFTHCRLEL